MPARLRPLCGPAPAARILTASAAVVLLPVAALAWPIIDDLETSSVLFLTADGATVSGSSSATWPSHCVAAYRTVYLTSNVAGAGGTLVSHFPYTAPSDVMDVTFGNGGGQCVLEYLPVAPADLTDGGQNDRVEVDFQAQTQGGTVEISVWDMDGGFVAHSRPSALLVQFPFSAWAGNVDPARIIKIRIRVLNAQQSVYLIQDVRCRRGSATTLKFDASGLIAGGPPYPLPWFVFRISDAGGPVEEMAMTLADARTAGGTQLSLSAECMDDGGDVGSFGSTALLAATWDGAGAWEDGSIVLPVDFSAVMGVEPQPFLPELPEVTLTATGFLLSFDVWREDSDGTIVTTSRRQMSFDVPAGQGAMGINPCCLPPVAARAGRVPGYSGFVLDFDLVATGAGVDRAKPLFEAMVTGDCEPATATGVTSQAPAATDAAALRARPSVTRSGTELVLGAPASRRQAIELFDVTGRLLRRLDVAAGASGVSWDGRTAAGLPVPAGVYFARAAGAGRDATARIVVVR